MAVKVKNQVITKRYALYHDDNMNVLPELKSDSIGFCVFSPPFVDLFSYSDSIEDMGNSKDYKEFFSHFGFLAEQLERVMMPGRIVAVHCMDLPTFKRNGDEIGIRDFPGDLIRCFVEKGFTYHSRHCIWKDPLVAATRTKAIGLAHKQLVKDSSVSRTGIPDYILAFRKKGVNPKPIPHPDGLTEYHGARSVPRDLDYFLNEKDQMRNKRSHWIWQQYASPVWFDIRQGKVLPYQEARDKDDQRHICPLQLDVLERCQTLWSTVGDIVLDPFLGVGSSVYVAVKNGRKGIGMELKGTYFRQACRNLTTLDKKMKSGREE